MTVNKIAAPVKNPQAHANAMGGVSFTPMNPLVVLRMAAASCFFGEPKYYAETASGAVCAGLPAPQLQDALQLADPVFQALAAVPREKALETAIDAALDYDAEGTLQVASALRNEDHIRVTPQVIMVRAAYHAKVSGTGLIKRYAPSILRRADEPATQLAYARQAFHGKPIPNALRKAWAAFLAEQSEYSLAKYRLETRQVKTVDVVNLVHPPATEALGKLVRGELKLNERTWESIVSENGASRAAWTRARDEVLLHPKGHMALLRNLRNLLAHDLVDATVCAALVAGATQGKQLPFRYYVAYDELHRASAPPALLDAVEASMMLSLGNLPAFKGRVMSLCDNSGSAQGAMTSELGSGKVSTLANLSGVLTGHVADDGHVGVFGDKLSTLAIRKGSSVFDQVDACESLAKGIGQFTENGIWLFFERALRTREHWDHVFIYSDMQAGHGDLYGTNPRAYAAFSCKDRNIDVSKLVAAYHRTVNPRALFYMVQMAGYQDALLPEYYRRAVILGGWGPGVLSFAHAMGRMWDDVEGAAPSKQESQG